MPRLVPLPGSDWTDTETGQIERLRELCRSTPNWELDSGRADEGSPWCAIYDGDDVVLHIARIDRSYVLATETEIMCQSRTIEHAVDRALSELTTMLRKVRSPVESE